MISINPKEVTVPELQRHLQSAVGPRPIAFASTIDKDGNANLSPFSFFNVFSSNPPILIFSPARSGRTNTTKDTYNNVKEVEEVVINIVNHEIVHQMSLSSSAYPKEVDEFVKAGFTPVASELIRPFRVKESPVQMECKVNQVIELGDQGGAGNLIICEVLRMHIDERVLDANGQIDQHKIDLVGRMGANWYVRANNEALFEVDKPITTLGIGFDQIPETIKNSEVLTGNDLGMLGNVESLPDQDAVNAFAKENNLKDFREKELHEAAKHLLSQGETIEAWKTLLFKK